LKISCRCPDYRGVLVPRCPYYTDSTVLLILYQLPLLGLINIQYFCPILVIVNWYTNCKGLQVSLLHNVLKVLLTCKVVHIIKGKAANQTSELGLQPSLFLFVVSKKQPKYMSEPLTSGTLAA